MVDHGARDHAQWSASSTDRNWNCSGALALTQDLPERTSEAADWGTCAHQIAEKCLREGRQADEFIGTTEKGKKYPFEVDEEMADTAQQYIDYVRRAMIDAAPAKSNPADLLHIEQKFSLASLDPPFEAGGTADAVIYKPTIKEIEVVDLKGGRGHVVEVIGNSQLRTYALGAMLANKGLAVETVKVTIVQPRAPHKDGRIRSETFHVVDLLEWTQELVDAMHRSFQAFRTFQDGDAPQSAWNAEFLSAGSHCKFCKAAGFCPALAQKATDEAGVWFDDQDQPRISNSPDMLSAEELAAKLDMLDMISEWINAVRSHAHSRAEEGVEIPGYQLVEKIGNRKFKEDVTAEQLEALLKNIGKPVSGAYAPAKMASPAQVEKALGSKHKADIADLVFRPVTGSNLVATEKTSRPALAPAVHRHFDILD